MAYTTINKHTAYFNTVTYTGNGGTNAITGVGHQPDFTWLKRRDASGNHNLYDAVRGVTKYLESSATSPEQTQQYGLTAFGTDGFTLGSNANMNGNGQSFVSWNWKAGAGQGTSNTDGTINTTYTSVNTTAGFSISKYTGTGSAATVGHGLGVAPKMIMYKRLDSADDWTIYHSFLGATKKADLNNTSAPSTNSTVFNDTAPTTSVMSVGTNGRTNGSGGSYIAYAFAEKTGFSKFGSFRGDGSNNGPFVYTGFKPAFVVTRKDGSDGWHMFDNKRDASNPEVHRLEADSSGGDYTGLSAGWMDFLSNGFKIRYNGGGINADGSDYFYFAFGQTLVGTNNIPATAR